LRWKKKKGTRRQKRENMLNLSGGDRGHSCRVSYGNRLVKTGNGTPRVVHVTPRKKEAGGGIRGPKKGVGSVLSAAVSRDTIG